MRPHQPFTIFHLLSIRLLVCSCEFSLWKVFMLCTIHSTPCFYFYFLKVHVHAQVHINSTLNLYMSICFCSLNKSEQCLDCQVHSDVGYNNAAPGGLSIVLHFTHECCYVSLVGGNVLKLKTVSWTTPIWEHLHCYFFSLNLLMFSFHFSSVYMWPQDLRYILTINKKSFCKRIAVRYF